MIYCLQYYQSVQVHLKVVYSLLYCLLYTQTNYDHVSGISEYNEQISEVVLWCKAHNLLLNAAKTKYLIFDFRHCNISHVPLSIDNSIVGHL